MTYKVGRIYRVPCARVVSPGGRIEWLPVHGPEHSDPEIGATTRHIHIDTRFMRGSTAAATLTGAGTTHTAVFTEGGWWEFTGIYQRLRRCHRTRTGIDLVHTGRLPTKYYEEWLPRMVGKRCRGRRCPHRGVEMQECPGGLLLCPLHNLVADAATETIIGAYSGEGKVCRDLLITPPEKEEK